ncbi:MULTISPECIES: phosphotransferase family protein [unclassified Mycolicibacterium]|uniref:phosphotransferase family protein n=1 Tax=unclassified Mycolicibacterium TaxID=2636767 RepID=UPI002ED91308
MTDVESLLHPARLGPALAKATADDRWATFDARLIAGGKSNLTFELTSAAGELILRRPPQGPLLPSAHDMAREARVQRALAQTSVPVASIVFTETAALTLDTPFYVMEKVAGHAIRDAMPAGYAPAPADRREIADALIDTLADLHGIQPASVGLDDYGRPEGFLARQVSRWRKQSLASRSRDVPALDALATALEADLPASQPPAIVHGDFRLDNCLMDPTDPGRVAAVLDWELSTIGDPLTDLGLLMFYWPQHGEPNIPLVPTVTTQEGFPPRSYLLSRYAERTGRDVSAVPFYEAFARFKFAVIIQGVAARSAAGMMAGQDFGEVESDVIRLAEAGLDALGAA